MDGHAHSNQRVRDAMAAGQAASVAAFRKLQDALDRESGGCCLDVVAKRIMQGLNARTVKLAQSDGKFTDKRTFADYRTRGLYVRMVMEVFGAITPQQHEISGSVGVLGLAEALALAERASGVIPIEDKVRQLLQLPAETKANNSKDNERGDKEEVADK